ncbi:hypothetical protein [Novosphingobium beihaiensis]|uniref:PASTA domain-containing protein n=1 Tax=Novosphingobium beihaiensis TaxID=2930389 RepID=A0ABT0BUQ9_9SPHN|nr:hypothetical protein [Novosphingobium beihaiensis]MCJ2188678.1 hypothetical protein [Novosphingobium beihaiensis]
MPASPTPTPAASGSQSVQVDFGSGKPNLYCHDYTSVQQEQAVRPGDAKVGDDTVLAVRAV